jgi:hypothetical protein
MPREFSTRKTDSRLRQYLLGKYHIGKIENNKQWRAYITVLKELDRLLGDDWEIYAY